MECKKDVVLVDFDEGMSKELRKAVYSTDTCQRYLSMRKHVGDLACRRRCNGQPLDDEEMRAARNKLSALTVELAGVIESCRAEVGER